MAGSGERSGSRPRLRPRARGAGGRGLGVPPGTKMLLLPGIDGSGRLFAPLLAASPWGLEPVVVPYPAERSLGYDELCALVLSRLPRGPFLLVAESFSGPVAVRVAATRPRGLAAVVLAATFLHRPLNPLLHPLRGLVGANLFGMRMPAALVRHFMAGPDAPAALVAEVQAAVAAVPAAVMAHRAAEAVQADVREDFVRVRAPVLWLAPARDRLIRTDGVDEVVALRPDTEVVSLDAPHMILQRCPHAALARIEELVARATRPASPAGAAG